MMGIQETVRKPDWLKVKAPGGETYKQVKGLLKSLKLNTVCEEARCPNVAECWSSGTATIMLMGDLCTRACKFCHVKTGNPKLLLDLEEPKKVAGAIRELKLNYVVLTSVDRDDLPDGGAGHFAQTVKEIKLLSPKTLVEVLAPDFQGQEGPLDLLCHSGIDVFAHNVETVERLTDEIRDRRCNYRVSLNVLSKAKSLQPSLYTKSSIMLGLGETQSEVLETMKELRFVGVDIVTLGQYLRPSNWNLPVKQYIHPTVFKFYETAGLEMGFISVPSGPLVRSSYRAAEKFLESKIRARQLRTKVELLNSSSVSDHSRVTY